MRIKTIPSFAFVSVCLLLGGSSSLFAASLGASFIGRGAGAGAILAPGDSAGLFPQTSWNNVDSGDPAVSGRTLSLIDSAGSFTGVKIIYDATDSWNSDGPTVTPDDKLMKGILKANPNPDTAPVNNSDRMLFTITNLPAGTYTIIVYLTENGASGKVSVNLGATTYYVEEQATFGGTFVPATSTTVGSYEFGPNYAGFTNVAPAGNGTITITARKFIEDPQVNDGIGVPAIQIIQQSGPAFPANTDTCSITNQPQSPPPVIEGGSVTLTVGTAGPCKIQWTKNNVPIGGAINSTLVYTAALADNGAQIRAVVYNNVNTNISNPATLEVDAATPPSLTQNFLKVDRWTGMTGTSIQPVKDAIANATVPNLTYYVAKGLEVPQTAPDLSDFGARAVGWVKPSVSGFYDFFIRSDDASALYLNPVNAGSGTNTLPDVNVDAPICEETDCCDAFVEIGVLNDDLTTSATTTTPIFLEAGKLYGFVALLKEAGGGDYVQVAWRLTNDVTAAAALLPIPADKCWTLATPAGQRASITTQPLPLTVTEGDSATFTVGITTTPAPGQYALQWYVNGTAIPNATGDSYIIPSTTLSDSNKMFFAIAQTLRGPLTSSVVKLSVLADTTPPVLRTASALRKNSTGVIQVGLTFNERLDPATVIAGNFTPSAGSVTSAAVATNSYGDYNAVALNTTGLTVGNTYNLTVNGVKDKRGNSLTTNISFTVGAATWAETGVPKRPGQVIPVGPNGFDILNGGRKEWEAYDEITLAFVKKTNDFDVKVRVMYAEPGSQWTRVGLQARNALNEGEPSSDGLGAGTNASAYAQTHVNPSQTIAQANRFDPTGATPGNPNSNNGHEQNQRLAVGSATSGWGSPGDPPTYPNAWLRLRRVADTIYGLRSTNGVDWIDQGSTVLLDQQPDMYVGASISVETGNIWTTGHNVWSSPFDARYDRLFVYQFRDFGDYIPAPLLSIGRSGGSVVLTYGGVLQSSLIVTGTYTDVSGAVSPYTVPATNASRFFRARSN